MEGGEGGGGGGGGGCILILATCLLLYHSPPYAFMDSLSLINISSKSNTRGVNCQTILYHTQTPAPRNQRTMAGGAWIIVDVQLFLACMYACGDVATIEAEVALASSLSSSCTTQLRTA